MTIGEWIYTVWFGMVFSGWVVALSLSLYAHRRFYQMWMAWGALLIDDPPYEYLRLRRSFMWCAVAFALGMQVLAWPHLIYHLMGHHL